ncbi:hypothetical protein DER46DRAFT_489553, partial [Fusarium sp. MPI-SDFR-AT-0072]
VDLNAGWYIHLDASTQDIVGLMQEGLCLSHDNMQTQYNSLEHFYCKRDRVWYYMRNYNLTGPQWSAKLKVWSLNMQVAARFRSEYFLAEGIYRVHGYDSSNERTVVYCLKLRSPEENLNIILDDRLLQGLWP